MAGGGAADHLPADAPRRELQVVGELGVHLAGEPGDPVPLAARAGVAPDLDLPVDRQLRPLPPLAVPQAGPPDRLAGAEEDLLPLVVEVGTAVDVVEVLEGELRPAPLPAARRGCDLVRPGDGGADRADVASFAPASCGLADGLDELRRPSSGRHSPRRCRSAACPSRLAPWPAPSVPATPGSGSPEAFSSVQVQPR